MPRTKISNLPAVHVSSLLFICALMPALLFKGPQIEFFAVTQVVLMLWLGWALLKSYNLELSIPRTPLALVLSLFWMWLGLSLMWSLGPGISAINFWWVGSLVFVFWLYVLTPDREALWTHVAGVVLVIGLVLALMGIYQVYVLEQHARSVFETRNTHAAFLNLIALPAAAYFMVLRQDHGPTHGQKHVLGAALFLLFLSVFLSSSRGAAFSLMISMVLLGGLTARLVSGRTLILLFGLMITAFLIANYSHAEVGERLPQLTHDTGRRVIWESSWNLLQATPWYGIGLGLFYLAYPPYRNPIDGSGGFFAHNDYLQIWIETGLPGLVLLLTILAATLWLYIRTLRKSRINKDVRIQLAGLFCGLVAVAGHSFVDFNLYILSIMMISGLVLARFHDLAVRELNVSFWKMRPSRYLGKQVFPLIVFLMVLIPMLYFVALSMANSYYDMGMALAREGKIQEADRSLAIAQRLTPGDERVSIAHADLYRHAIGLLPPGADAGKQALYEDTLRFLDRAQAANALRGLTYVVRARLYQENPELAGADWQKLAAEAFQKALDLNPRLFLGRMDYGALLVQMGRKRQALELLEDGLKHEYFNIPDLIPYYKLTARLQREAGRVEQAASLEARMRELEGRAAYRYQLRGF